MTNPDGFTAGEAAELTGVKYPTLDYWAKSGFLTPSVQGATGSGSRRRYSFADLVAVVMVRTARTTDVSFGFLQPAVAYIQRLDAVEELDRETRLVVEATRIYHTSGEAIPPAVADGVSLLLPLGGIVRYVRDRVEHMELMKMAHRWRPEEPA